MSPQQRVEKLCDLLRERIPGIGIEVDAPSRPKGDWFLDARLGDRSFVVEFRPALGFGLSSTPGEGLGEGPDELWDQEGDLVERVVTLIRTAAQTEPQRVRLLQELRTRQRVTQVELAGKLGIQQPTLSKLERREDVNLGTLRRYVQALGGELHITARFADGSVEIGSGGEAEEPRGASR